jgi:hypothetical protein
MLSTGIGQAAPKYILYASAYLSLRFGTSCAFINEQGKKNARIKIYSLYMRVILELRISMPVKAVL